jgi:hypothetical protein
MFKFLSLVSAMNNEKNYTNLFIIPAEYIRFNLLNVVYVSGLKSHHKLLPTCY